MENIGGFFEFELSDGPFKCHPESYSLSIGRSCLSLIMEIEKPKKVFIPYYSCDALVEPFHKLKIEYEYYHIDHNLNIVSMPNLESKEMILVCDFFGLKSEYINRIATQFKNRIIIDDTHAFFKANDNSRYSFTSARKYFGVADGAFLYSPRQISDFEKVPRFEDVDIKHNVLRFNGKLDEAYARYKKYEASLNSDVRKISLLSEKILSHIDFSRAKAIRTRNFNYLHQSLSKYNSFVFTEFTDHPFCYPFLPKLELDINYFHSKGIFIPRFWLDTCDRENADTFNFECELSRKLLPLPIDHRYSIEEMRQIVEIIKNQVNG